MYLNPGSGNIEVAPVTDGGVTAYEQIVALGDGVNAGRMAGVTPGLQLKTAGPSFLTTPLGEAQSLYAGVAPWGSLRTVQEPVSLFYDVFDGAIDTAKWTTSGTAPTVTGGDLTVDSGTGISGSSRITSVPLFSTAGNSFLLFSQVVTFEASPVANVYRFWGTGAMVGSPAYQGAAANPSLVVANGLGFELDTAGNLYAVVYSNSVPNFRQSVTRPTDGLAHRYIIAKRGDLFVFLIDNLDVPVATANFASPVVQTLPVLYAAFNNSTAPAAHTFKVAGMVVSDTGGARMSPNGSLLVADPVHTNVHLTFTSAAPVVADTLLTMALNKGGVTSSPTTIPVSAGKTLRITAIIVALRTTTAVLPFGKLTVRVNYSGAAVLASPPVLYVPVSGTAAVIGNTGVAPLSSGQGGLLDLTGPAQVGFSFSNNVNTNVADISVAGYEFAA